MLTITRSISWLLSLAVALPVTATADFKEEFVEKMLAAESQRLEGIDNVLVIEKTMGTQRVSYFETATTTLEDGTTVNYLSFVSPGEIARRSDPDNPMSQATPDDLRGAAGRLEQQSPAVEAEVRQEIRESGFPPGIAEMMMSGGDDPRTPQQEKRPWLSANPSDTAGMYATMLRGAAVGREEEAQRKQQEKANLDGRLEMAEKMRHTGRQTVNARPAECFLASDLDYEQQDDGTTFKIDSIELCADAERYVPLRMKMQGEASEPGQDPRPVTIERSDYQYVTPGGCGTYARPGRSVMRISGTMTPEQEREMAEAQAQMAEFKAQLDAMPPAQKQMIMSQMGGRMEMMEKMASGGGVEVETYLMEVRCNGGPPSPEDYMRSLR